jgi:hypothetical protein
MRSSRPFLASSTRSTTAKVALDLGLRRAGAVRAKNELGRRAAAKRPYLVTGGCQRRVHATTVEIPLVRLEQERECFALISQ